MKAAIRGVCRCVTACIALSLALTTTAHAQYEDLAEPAWYIGPFIGGAFPDAGRHASAGFAFQGVAGRRLLESVAVEGHLFKTSFSGDTPYPDQDVLGLGVDLALGNIVPGNPVFLMGAGQVRQKAGGNSKTSTFGDVGLGIYLPFTVAGELWRVEGRYKVASDDATGDLLGDFYLNAGFLFAYGRPPPPPPPTDADGDGIPDDQDQCPDTPRWARADASGCTPDGDGDGVDDSKDACAATAAGTPVDEYGCEVKTKPVESALQPAANPDEDGDGIGDNTDACPHTVPRFNVDAKGCVIPEDVTLKNVHFDINSARLTADGYALLRDVAASLKADTGITLEVQGHADSTGPTKLNDRLSRDRAEVVRDFLTYLGIDASRLTIKGFGEAQPIRDNKSDESRSYNRRVQFVRTSPKP